MSVAAQNYPMPGAVPDPAVICTGCPGNNSVSEPSSGKPTFPYDSPVKVHVGRFVDSQTTASVQNRGMRTVRAGAVRIGPASRNRLYVALGETLGAYALDTFFTNKLLQPMVAVNTIHTGRIYGGRNPYEKLAMPDRFFYAEATFSGWTNPLIDAQGVLADFEADDRGYVYIGTYNFGWGIEADSGGTDGSHLSFVAQVTDDQATSLMLLRSGSSYYVYVGGHSNARLFDVTAPAAPQLLSSRSGVSKVIQAWSKYEASERVALLNADSHVRVYTYAALIANGAPLVDVAPAGGKFFTDLSFDDDGNLWMVESANTTPTTSLLWRLTPSGGGYTTTTMDVYGTAFSPIKIHASAGYVAVVGAGPTVPEGDLRLFRMAGGVPQLLNTNGFFGKYYHYAPAGYANPGIYSIPWNVRILAQGGKTYLFYSAYGLGDVYELGDEPRVTSMTPLSGLPAGGTNVTIYGSGFAAGATVTFDGVPASTSTFVNANQMTAVSPIHASGSVNVVVSVPAAADMIAPRPFSYVLTTPKQLVATAPDTTSVSVSWNTVPGAAFYEVSRRTTPAGGWEVIGTPAGNAFSDTGRTAETTYIYRVRAGDPAANYSGYSNVDLATTMDPASSTITAGMFIRAADLTNLRTRVLAVCAAAGFTPTFTGVANGPILKIHLTDLRGYLSLARIDLGFGPLVITDPVVTEGTTPVKAVHFNELLDWMR